MTSTARPAGIDTRHLDPEIRPQDDLFGYLNGTWLRDYQIPDDRAVDGAFRTLYDRAELDVQAIIENAASSGSSDADARRVGDLYLSYMDADRVEAAGLDPIRTELDAVTNASTKAELAALLGEFERTGVRNLISTYVDTDAKNSSRYLLHLNQSGIGLPDESYFREDRYADIRTEYVAHIGRMFTLAGFDYDPQIVLDLETQIAAAHWDVVKRRDADLTYNLANIDEIPSANPGFDWQPWLATLTSDVATITEVIVREPSFLTSMAQLWEATPLTTWQAWATTRVLTSRASLLPTAFVEENFAFYGKTLSGTQALRERWKRAVAVVEELFGDAVGKLYVAQHFPPAAKQAINELVDNLLEAYRRSIGTLDWMGPQTREAALTKLGKFTPKVGYPDKWRDYSAVTIDVDDLVGNYRRAHAVEFDRDLAKLGGPVDRDEWFMTPQTVNAYYNPGMNEIVFPAAILQPPFFDPDADDAANYGGIGAVIGHEIGHGFDDQGAKYDGDGNLVDWWTDDDRAEFGRRAKVLIDQYNGFEPADLAGHHVNGDLTIGENIGDLGGLTIALAAYEISLDGQPAPVIDGLTGLQRVYLGWAQVWRAKAREAEAIRRLAVDPHSPPEFRCNGVVSNIDSFYSAFDVAPGDGMFLEPEARVKIW